jgi:hypothetical protein
MKCFTHLQTDAVAVCANCGKALCPSCVTKSDSGKICCSESCLAATSEMEQTWEILKRRSTKGHRINGYFTLGTGCVFGIFAGLSILIKEWPLVLFLGSTSAIFIVTGFVFLKLSKTTALKHKKAGQ